jgi:hypothetical protein
MKNIEILLPDFEIEELVSQQLVIDEPHIVTLGNEWEIIPTNASLNRAHHWLTTVNCATISAWRKEHNRQTNDSLNKELQRRLRDFQYGVIKLKGFYQEIGQEADFENSFLTFDIHRDPVFFQNLSYLSESFGQDCFLYKAANDDNAYLIGTNKQKGYGTRELAGRLRIGNLSAKNYSEIGSGRISFE